MAAARDEGNRRAPEDEGKAEAEVHQGFRRSANALSQLYAHSVASQRASFRAGERRAMEGVYQWISSQNEEASVSVADVLGYIQNEIERRGGMAGSPQQPANSSPSADVQSSIFEFGNVVPDLDSQQWQTDLAGTARIPDALPRPSQQDVHLYHPVHFPGYGHVDSPPSNHSPPNQHSLQSDLSEQSSDMDHDSPCK